MAGQPKLPDGVSVEWSDSGSEVYRVVVGPMDNNVYVLRCKQRSRHSEFATGDSTH